MRDLLSNIEFARPIFFWLALTLPLLWLRFRDHNFPLMMLRTLVIVLLILTLANPQTVSRQIKDSQEGERIFVFDLSRSIPPSMREWMASAVQKFAPNRRDRFFFFASETKEAGGWKEWLGGTPAQQGALRPEKTNLENVFATLLALPPAARSAYLFTDGWETQGNVERLLPSIAGSNLKIYPIIPPETPRIANVAVTKLLAPTHGNSGEAVNLKVVVENQNDREVEGTLALTRNGEKLKTEVIKLKPGSQIFSYEVSLPESGQTSYGATFRASRPDLDNYAADNRAVTWITVRSKAKVLLLNGQGSSGRYLEEILKRQGLEVNSRAAGDGSAAPAGYGVVIFNNVEREKLSPSYLTAVERYVANGGSFLMLGGEASFAPNSYRRTPIENLLPVEPKEPRREEKNRAVVLVIDKSGSMREENKMLYAQEAAKAVARQLKDNDLLAVVGFDVSPFVVVPMETVGRLRATVETQIGRLKPGGQTYFYPALLEAKRQIERANSNRKHVILISDGETRGTQGELIDLVNVMKNEMKITVSAVAIGTEADIRIMKRISQYGGGLFHHTIDPSTLPQIVLQQLQNDSREAPQAEKPYVPIQERTSEVLAGFPIRSYPTLRGYMETELKRDAHLDLAIPREDRKAPLMASWHYGRGKSLAWTTDLDGRWSRSWIQWPELQRFWDKVFAWLRPEQEPIPSHEARVSFAGHQPILDLFVYEEASLNSRFHFTLSGKGTKSDGTLKKLADGHFQTTLPIYAPGDYRIEVTEDRKNRQISYPSIGYTLSNIFDGEIPRHEFNNTLLAKLAQSTGGEINPKSFDTTGSREFSTTSKPMREPLIVAAFLLFMLEIALRKLFFMEP
ncbi:MAG: glutamine amidotransferase [Alphaproteobacteria bacterium]